MYTVKLYTAKQARNLLNSMRELEGGAEDLPEDIDESAFDDAKAAEIQAAEATGTERLKVVAMEEELLQLMKKKYKLVSGEEWKSTAPQERQMSGLGTGVAPPAEEPEQQEQEEIPPSPASVFAKAMFFYAAAEGGKDDTPHATVISTHRKAIVLLLVFVVGVLLQSLTEALAFA